MADGKQHLREVLAGLAIVLLMSSTGVVDRWVPAVIYGPLRADDPDLVSRVASQLLSPSSEPYNLTNPDDDCWGQAEQMRVVQALTRNKTGGFFIETGAHNGERLSNTLLLERRFGWRGLLMEPSRHHFAQLRLKHRRAWALEACISHTGTAFQAVFRVQLEHTVNTVEDGLAAQLFSDRTKFFKHPEQNITKYAVECVPLYTVLLALGQTSVDFFSLDVEGTEMGVLAYLPWHLLDIKIVLVEYYIGFMWNPQTDLMRSVMESHGYLAMHLQNDWLFVRGDCEYARDAETIVRRVRQEIADSKDNSIHNPFND